DLFLFAAAQMNAKPSACVVVEDSSAGIRGGVAAGMTVLGFHGGSHCRDGHADDLRAAGATLVFDDMRQLPAILGRLSQKTSPLAGFSAL
ncbi:HAD family phosphatase, partial [Bradyrhizobium sp.]